MSLSFKRVGFVGVGLIGGSLALDLKQSGQVEEVIGADLDVQNLAQAEDLGILDRSGSLAEVAETSDLVVVATPPSDIASALTEVAQLARPGVVLTDVGSVKVAILEAIEGQIPSGVHFVGGHPVAGTEKSGATAAFAGLFRGRRCILTPTAETDADAVAAVRSLWELVGAEVLEMAPELHDRVCAAISHLPHVAAYALTSSVGAWAQQHEEIYGLGAGGFTDTTRIASSNARMWRDIFLLNRQSVLSAVDTFTEKLAELRRLIDTGDAAGLEALFAEMKKVRSRTLGGR